MLSKLFRFLSVFLFISTVATAQTVSWLVKDRDLSAPPGSPSQGDRYIVGSAPTGAWSGHANDVAVWNGGQWKFIDAETGLSAWIADEPTHVIYFNGTRWGPEPPIPVLTLPAPSGGDDTATLTSYFTLSKTLGLALNGGGQTYRVCTNLEMPDGPWEFDDFSLLDICPTATRRVLVKTSGSGPITLRRGKIDTNATTTDGTVADAAKIWISGINGIILEDIDVSGDGPGFGVRIPGSDNVYLRRVYVHDMQWSAATDPGVEQIVGVGIGASTRVTLDDVTIENLTSLIPWSAAEVITTNKASPYRWNGANAYRATNTGTTAAPGPTHTSGTVADGGGVNWEYLGPASMAVRAWQTDGLDFNRAQHVTVLGGRIQNTGEGSDGYGDYIKFYGTQYIDQDSWGQKWIGTTNGSGSYGTQHIRSGLGGIVLSGGANADSNQHDMQFDGCSIFDVGGNGNWSASTVQGIEVFSAVANPTNILINNCTAIDRPDRAATISIASPAVVTVLSHNKRLNEPMTFATSGALPTGLSVGTTYYVKSILGKDTFTVSASAGGAVINTSGTQSGVHTVTRIKRMQYGLYNQASSLEVKTRNFYTSGATVADTFPSSWLGQENITTASIQLAGRAARSRSIVTLANGLDSDIAIGTSYIKIFGPTGAFSLGGFVPTLTDGEEIWVYNTTTQAMTIVNEDGLSAPADRIATKSGANVVLPAASSYAHFIHDGALSRWILLGSGVN